MLINIPPFSATALEPFLFFQPYLFLLADTDVSGERKTRNQWLAPLEMRLPYLGRLPRHNRKVQRREHAANKGEILLMPLPEQGLSLLVGEQSAFPPVTGSRNSRPFDIPQPPRLTSSDRKSVV